MKKLYVLLYLGMFLFIFGCLRAEDTNDSDIAAANRLSKAFSKVSEKAFPSVVVIENLQSGKMRKLEQLPPEFERFFGRPVRPKPEKEGRPGQEGRPFPVGFGSGVVIRENGYIVTNNHVIDGAENLRVKFQDGTVYDNFLNKDSVKIVSVDEQSDLVVLKINDEGKTFKALTFANSDDVSVGEWAIAIGAPFNYDYTLTVGVISQKGRHNVFKNRIVENYIQTDASINPGNSGGPLLNIKGEIIGINNFIANGGGVASSAGLGFAIASNIVKNVTEQIINDGKVNRPWLGIMMTDLTPEDRKNYSIEKGVLIKEVKKGDPADKAGVQSGDIVLKVGNTICNSAYEVQTAVLKHKPGETINMTINRNQKELTLKIVAVLRDNNSENMGSNGEVPTIKELGLSLKEVDSGVEIQAVEELSEAFQKGLKPGMKIISINRVPVTKIEEVNKIVKDFSGDNIMLKLSFQNKEFIEFLRIR